MPAKFHYLILFLFFLTSLSYGQFSWIKKAKTSEKNEIILITNPVYNEIKLDSTGTDFAEYFIFDMDGKQIRQGWFMGSIPLKFLNPGSYFLTIRTKNEIFKRQFLKLKSDDGMSMLLRQSE